MNYSVGEFRANIRKALNEVDAGELVVITRHEKEYLLVTVSHWNNAQTRAAQTGQTELITSEVSSDIRPVAAWKNKLSPDEVLKGNEDSLFLCEHGHAYRLCKYEKCRKKAL